MLTRAWIVQKMDEFKAAEAEHLGIANANHGAFEAYKVLLAEFDKGGDDNPPIPLEQLLPPGAVIQEGE